MSIHVALHHRTSYRYDRPVGHGAHVVRLRPAPHCRSRILSYSLKVGPAEHFVNWQQDPQANYLARLVFLEKAERLDVVVDLVVEMSVQNPFDFFLEEHAETYPFDYDEAQARELAPFLVLEPPGPELARWIARFKGHELRTNDFLVEVNSAIQAAIGYNIRMEPGVQTPEETLTMASGSCRDSAWLLVMLMRHLGLAARFVSGYLIQLKPDVKSLDGPSGTEVDFTDLHAWAEVYLPGGGWIGLDPTSGLLAGEGHLPLACSPEPSSAAPVSGGVEPCETEMEHEMTLTRIYESPRTTQPYSDEQWQKIVASGRLTDQQLSAMDVRLTMGGEPTFISMDDFDGDEWNTTAVGPDKRRLSSELIKRMHQRFAPGGLLFYGQGKWYPGEQLPRYSLNCYWRKDGHPIWQDVALIADEATDYGHTAADAKAFGLALAKALGADAKWMMPAYEDAYYYLWKERRLPSNVDIAKSNLKDQLERERIARIFDHGLNEAVGYVLPLKRADTPLGQRWASGPWFLRDEMLYVLPGDSPIGLRLPLESLPWVAEEDFPWAIPADPTRDLPPLVADSGRRIAMQRRALEREKAAPADYGLRDQARLFPEGKALPAAPESPERQPDPSNPPAGSPAPRCASSRAMVGCTSSCRPSMKPRIFSTSSPASNKPPPCSKCPSSSKALRPSLTRASRCSKSPRTPA